MIYGFANLLLGATATSLSSEERFPLITFIVLFPIVVLGIFYLLVSRHHGKLYAPGDYKDDKSFLRTLSQEEREQKLEKEVEEALPPAAINTHRTAERSEFQIAPPAAPLNQIREELRLVEDLTIRKFERELGQRAQRDVGVGDIGVSFDALFTDDTRFTFLEIKSLRNTMINASMLDRVMYNAVVADKYLNSNMKLILAVIYSFDKEELPRIESFWRRRIEKCPATIDLRFISREEINP